MYFSNIPDIKYDTKPVSYPFSESDYTTAKNFFRRYKINEDIFGYTVLYNKVAVEDVYITSTDVGGLGVEATPRRRIVVERKRVGQRRALAHAGESKSAILLNVINVVLIHAHFGRRHI